MKHYFHQPTSGKQFETAKKKEQPWIKNAGDMNLSTASETAFFTSGVFFNQVEYFNGKLFTLTFMVNF